MNKFVTIVILVFGFAVIGPPASAHDLLWRGES